MIWDIILKELESKITQEQYNKYIKNLVFDEKNSKSDLKILLANNIFIANWVNRNYADKIAILFENETEIKPTIKIKVKEIKENRRNKTQYDTKIVQINKKQSIINPSLTFETFVVGESNKFAFKVSEKVAQNQGTLYNPLFISGDTGLGKTHLLNAIGNYNIGKKNVILINCEEFLNDFTYNLANKTMDKFRNKYRNCDYLLVDDIQFLIGKLQTQEEFFHTLNVLKENNKQLVFTSDKQIKDLGIEERLKSRFQNGVTAQIQAPELETKIAIIKKKCEIDLIQLNDEIINFIATNVNNNIRTIEGILMTINSYASVFNQEITIDFVKNAIKSFKNTNIEKITINNIVNETSKYLNIKPADIKSKKRTKDILLAKKIVIYLGRKLTRNSMPELANFLEFKDHSSISKAMKKIQKEIENNKELELKIEEIENKIKDSKINN
ncbi:chromosomal replication initiator protein DnaA [Helicobacter sp. MIT 99-5507]|uniref:chromosomal replication initiator protein DnaA n=1 Tax=Helicobacter sp. MIT 99-5507 TaxID=152489 RepID=UPI000E1E5E90|nr:chromosomal replication initiator protein DnaA [Helicobacter sp. MIT 99-5507]RDU58054.1 chromosomal replication initiator protein DnaA [Helicobacter sp. MIT 99-5507]